ncbi:HNH endonuclease [Aliterella atlantica]|uniref:HNH endonuclease n=1 Tax=Aliterella atlantica TaxID=1827278 RepID=UPI001364AEDB|nr:HNH endonuclease signature motif containing protein [Aliterella atlantica]
MDNLTFDPEKVYLGSLCKYGHDYQDTGKSLRFKKTGICKECSRQHCLNRYRKNPQEYKAKARAYQKQHPEKRKEWSTKSNLNRRDYKQQWAFRNRDRLLKQKREYYYANRDYYLERKRQRLQTPQGRMVVRVSNCKRRAIKKTNHHVNYTAEQVKQLFLDFNNCCAYCGSKKNLSLDHFLPLSRGGADCFGNLIPACGLCNSSKSAADPKEWYERQPFYSSRRWKKILTALGKSEVSYNQIPLF